MFRLTSPFPAALQHSGALDMQTAVCKSSELQQLLCVQADKPETCLLFMDRPQAEDYLQVCHVCLRHHVLRFLHIGFTAERVLLWLVIC
jgi:hypothetical protein